MGWNALAAVEQEEHGYEVLPLVLFRANAGITHSASVGRGDAVRFSCGIEMEVIKIVHGFQSPMSGRAPVSEAHLRPLVALSDSEIAALKEDGFQEVMSGSS
jgi:hypothetical protein